MTAPAGHCRAKSPLREAYMPGFSPKMVKIGFKALFFAGMVIASSTVSKHIQHEYSINIHRSYYYINPDRFDHLDADHTWKKIV